MLKGFTHARLACGCRIAFREGQHRRIRRLYRAARKHDAARLRIDMQKRRLEGGRREKGVDEDAFLFRLG